VAIYLVRHTAPDVKPGICYGASNVPVHEAEFARVMPLVDETIPKTALIVASPLTRCRRLADFLAASSETREVIVDEHFIERDLGRWTGLHSRDIVKDDDAAYTKNFLDHWPPPQFENGERVMRGDGIAPKLGAGESARAMERRVLAGFDAAWERAAGRSLVIVAHAGPIAAMIAKWQGDPFGRRVRPAPACGDVVQLTFQQGRQQAIIVRRASPPAEQDDF
jgi:broad specificity phosphatase PhoE